MQQQNQLLLVIEFLWLNGLAQGLVAYVSDRAPLSCPTSNLKTLWYRTTNSSTGNCQRPLIYKDTVLCEQLSQGSNVEGSFRHRLSFLSSNGGRLQTLVIGNVEKSDAGKYTCIDSVHWRLVCQLDLFVLERAPGSTVSAVMSLFTTINSRQFSASSAVRQEIRVTEAEKEIQLSTQNVVSVSKIPGFLSANWITMVALTSSIAFLLITVLLLTFYIVHLRRQLKHRPVAADGIIGSLEGSPLGQTTIVRSMSDESTVVSVSHSPSDLPDLVSTESSRESYDYPLGSWVNHPDSTSSSTSSAVLQSDANTQREVSDRRHHIEGPRPYINVNPTMVLQSAFLGTTESSQEYLVPDAIGNPGRSRIRSWVHRSDPTTSSSSSMVSENDANSQREVSNWRQRTEGQRSYINVNPTTVGLSASLVSTELSHESFENPAVSDATANPGRPGTSAWVYHPSSTTSSSSSVVSKSNVKSHRDGSAKRNQIEGPRSYINVNQTTIGLLRNANPVRPDLARLTNRLSWSNRHPRQHERRRGRTSAINKFGTDDASIPLRSDADDDSCDYINIRCSAEYLHQHSWCSTHSHRNSLPGVHEENPETAPYANTRELKLAPTHGRN